MKKKVFISFDYDHDRDIKNNLVRQSRDPNSPFEIRDESIQVPIEARWRDVVRNRMQHCDYVIVLCGEHTDTATGVTAELTIAQELGIPYFLLRGRRSVECRKPQHARREDLMHPWTWTELERMLS